jgi:hypothetical protein
VYRFQRVERRIPMEIPVVISSEGHAPNTESTFTANVSSQGAQLISARRWRKGEHVTITSHAGEFRSSARVMYCHLHGESYAVGVQFLEQKGRWVVDLKK